MNIQADKILLAKLILETENESLISKIKEIVLANSTDEIPEWHKEIVLQRIAESRIEDYIPWNEAKKQLSHK